MKEMSDLICGKAAVGGNYNSTRDSDTKAGTSIAYINGVKRDDEFKEIRLMN